MRHEPQETTALLQRFYQDLLSRFGIQHWWPGDSPWEVTVGAVLTQNTNWNNVEKAINRLKEAGALEPDVILELEPEALAQLIRPAGYFNVKSERLKNVAYWWRANVPCADRELPELRASLLAVKGVGEETADSILLYAFERCVFVVDAYTRRLLTRHGMIDAAASYSDVQQLFEKQLPQSTSLFNEYHALIVALGKHHCRPKPNCEECPLKWHLA